MKMRKKIIRNICYRCKLLLAYVYLHLFKRDILRKEIWLITEKRTEARDNGYHLFKYLTDNHKDIFPVYAIDTHGTDFKKINHLGKVVQYDSFEHFVYFIAARYRIGGQIQGGKPYIDVANQKTFKILRNKKQVHFFIKHGIAKDDIPDAYDYRRAGYDVMFCGAKREYEYYKDQYDYPENRINCPGLCRFDNLLSEHRTEKIILIMPTYRKWLRPNDSAKKATDEEKSAFLNSEYYAKYASLINNEVLTKALKEAGYKLVFYLHYTMQPFMDLFDDGIDKTIVTLAKRTEYDVQDLLMKSSVLVTDYSSVFFDFGYMKKPVVFYQFDSERYRRDHYLKGWFHYEQDAPGPIYREESALVEYILKYCIDNCTMESCYLERMQGLFINMDQKNCQRVYETIKRY